MVYIKIDRMQISDFSEKLYVLIPDFIIMKGLLQ
jgi:hypothetical protein